MKIEIKGCEVDIKKEEEVLNDGKVIVSLLDFEDRTFENYKELPEKLKMGYIGDRYYGIDSLFWTNEKRESSKYYKDISEGWVKISTKNLKTDSADVELDDIMYLKYKPNIKGLMLVLDELFVMDMKSRHGLNVVHENVYDNRAVEYMLCTVIPFKYPCVPHRGYIIDSLKTKSDYIKPFEEKYIPLSGIAPTVFGECLRCCQRIAYRGMNDGDIAMNMDGAQISFVNILAILNKIASEYGECSEETCKFVTDFMRAHDEKKCHLQGSEISELDDILCCNEYHEWPVESAMRMAIALCKWKERDETFLSMKNNVDTREFLNGEWKRSY